jgi:hypothetical protein
MIQLTQAHRALAPYRRNANAIRLFWWLSFELDLVDYRPLKIDHIAQAVRMDKGQVCRAIRKLVIYGLIQRNGRAGPRGAFTYRVVPNPQTPTFREITTPSAA